MHRIVEIVQNNFEVSHVALEKKTNGGDTRRRHSKTRKNRIKFEDEKIKLERGRRRHQRGRYKPTTKLWDMLDELEEVKSKARK